jgi:redox-sensing transcriptional repressor
VPLYTPVFLSASRGSSGEVARVTVSSNGKVPVPTLERLATYLRFLIDLGQSRVDTISSAEVERQTGINAAQFRKDLSYFGEFGKPGVGYNVLDLQTRIARILKIDREQRVILVGAGNLGSALVGYPGLKEHRFNLVAVFDNNYGKIGRPLWALEILDVVRIPEVNAKLHARIAILAVPAIAAQGVADVLVSAGIDAVLNFAPVLLRVPDHVFVRNVSFLQELAVLSYHLSADVPLAQEDSDSADYADALPSLLADTAVGAASSTRARSG